MSKLSILTAKQQAELNKAVVQYLQPILSDTPEDETSNTLTKLMRALDVQDTSVNDVIPNYLEKKWSTIMRLQKRIMDLENDLDNVKAIMQSSPATFSNSTHKINWLPSTASQVFKTQTNQQVNTVTIHPFLPIIVCGCSDGTIVVWNLAVDDTTPEKIIKAHTRSVNKIVWSNKPIEVTNGTHEYVFASCSSDLSVKVWNGATYKQLRNLLGHEHTVSSLCFSKSDPKLLYTVSRDKTIKIWDIINGVSLKSYIGHSDWVREIDMIGSISDKLGDFLLTCSNDQSIRLSHANSGTGLCLFVGHSHVIEDIKFLPLLSSRYIDEFLGKSSARFSSIPTSLITEEVYTSVFGFKYCVSCGRDNTIKLWLIPPPVLQPHRHPLPANINNSQGWLIDTFVGHTSWVKGLYVHPNGRFIFSCSDDKTIKVWDLEMLVSDGKVKCIQTLKGHEGFVTSIQFAGIEGGEELGEIESKMRCLFVSGGVDCTVRVWR